MTYSGSPNPDPGEVKRDEETLQRQRDEKAEQDRLEEERRILEQEVPFWRRQKQLEGDEFTPDPEGFDSNNSYWTEGLSVIADMDASDTATIKVRQQGGSAQTDIDYGGSSWFSGHLLS